MRGPYASCESDGGYVEQRNGGCLYQLRGDFEGSMRKEAWRLAGSMTGKFNARRHVGYVP